MASASQAQTIPGAVGASMRAAKLARAGQRAFVGGLLALLTACSGTSELFNNIAPPAGAGAAARPRSAPGRSGSG